MKIFSYIIIALAVVLIGFNLTQVDFSNPFSEDSSVALIGVVAGLCAIVLMIVFRISKTIDDKTK